MMRMYIFPISLILILIFTSNFINTCDEILHPQDHFCRADFVSLLLPKNKTITTIGNKYYVKILQNFKHSRRANMLLRKGLYSGITSSLSGFDLNLDQEYLIAGNIMNGRAYTGKCNLVTLWNRLTPFNIKALTDIYPYVCNCKIHYCYDMSTFHLVTLNNYTCPLLMKNSMCYTNFGFCAVNTKKKCVWARNPELLECLERHSLHFMHIK